jgi:hypothetical protein
MHGACDAFLAMVWTAARNGANAILQAAQPGWELDLPRQKRAGSSYRPHSISENKGNALACDSGRKSVYQFDRE